MLSLDAKIESILFYKGEPVSYKELLAILKEDPEAIKEAIAVLRERLANSGLSLIENSGEVGLYTSPEAGKMIEDLRKDELSKELSKAALETLSIVLYGKDVARSDIDFIRGVNSSFILRNLLIRGLIERKEHPTDSRKNVYVPTLALLSFMGVEQLIDLPDYETIRASLEESKEKTNEAE
ncbi:MAG: SMC-Scp complex subunit ScpB [Candidatus Pacebacteria bacterium]|nr:SMC-Scp complex subunit ScpB [Candidatus Paceibacterota bacterium]MBP9851771.1 SMC-Scp complex subunit ScpB [Candidatus Paceibacterota bacterium]